MKTRLGIITAVGLAAASSMGVTSVLHKHLQLAESLERQPSG